MYSSAMANINLLNEGLFVSNFPLHAACFQGNVELAKKLLSAGCDVYQEDGFRAWTPVHWASFGGHWACLAVISQLHRNIHWDVHNTRYRQTPTHIAAVHGRSECMQWLMQNGASLSIQDYMGDTPLHKAVKSGSLDCVKLLASHGPLLSITNKDGQSALDIAKQFAEMNPSVCQFLEGATLSQEHTSFFPTSSSPIEMNGEGIYCSPTKRPLHGHLLSNDHDMEMMEECGGVKGSIINAAGDARSASVFSCIRFGGIKRSRDDDDMPEMKKKRLFEPTASEKFGSSSNNNILYSYNSVLAVSAEPCRPAAENNFTENGMHEAHAFPKPCPASSHPWAFADVQSSGSFVDHCNSLQQQISYESMLLEYINPTDHGF